MTSDETFGGRRAGVDRRGWAYLATAVVVTVLAGFVAPVLSYAALAAAAGGAWMTRQHPVVRWTLTGLALALIAALALGFAVSTTGHGYAGGPVARKP